MSEVLLECATKADAQKQQAKIEKMDSAISLMQQRFDKLSAMSDQLSRSQLQQGHRISNAEAAVAGKIDRSEVDHLQALVAKVETFDEFKVSTIRAVSHLQDFERHTVAQLRAVTARLEGADDALQRHQTEIGKLATKKELHALAKAAAAQSEELAICARRTETEEVRLQQQ